MKRIRLTEGDLHNIIKKSVKRVLKESRDRFNEEKFDKWKNETHIPKSTLDILNYVLEKIGAYGIDEEEVIPIRNRGGYTVGWAKGFTISYCTSSNENGPDVDYSADLLKFIKGLGFRIENSYGDNGMDSSTNYNDTFWYYDFIYNPSVVWEDDFMIWGNHDEDYDEDDDDDDYYNDDNY